MRPSARDLRTMPGELFWRAFGEHDATLLRASKNGTSLVHEGALQRSIENARKDALAFIERTGEAPGTAKLRYQRAIAENTIAQERHKAAIARQKEAPDAG